MKEIANFSETDFFFSKKSWSNSEMIGKVPIFF
jgi:hypothetical protein